MNTDFNLPYSQKYDVNLATASSSRSGYRIKPQQVRLQQQNPRQRDRENFETELPAQPSNDKPNVGPQNSYAMYDTLQQRNGGNRNSGARRRGAGRRKDEPVLQDESIADGDVAELSRSEARQQQFNKTKLCKFFIMGICTKNEQCLFAHDKREMRPLPNLGRTKLCKTLIEKGICRNADCTYAHSKDELRATSAFLKTKLCKFYMNNTANGIPESSCALGDACRYAHSEAELKENLDEQARITQEQLHLEHHGNSSGSPASRTQKSRSPQAQSVHSGLSAPTAPQSFDSQVTQSPQHRSEFAQYQQRPKASRGIGGNSNLFSPGLVSKKTPLSRAIAADPSFMRIAAEPSHFSRARNLEANSLCADYRDDDVLISDYASDTWNPDHSDVMRLVSDIPRHNSTPTSFGASAHHRSSRQSSCGSECSDAAYDVWTQQLLPQMTNRAQKPIIPSKPTIGGLRKNTLTANSFASLEVLAEDEPAFVALSECEEDGCRIERASIVAEDPAMGEHTVTANNDASWVVKNTFIEFRDDDVTRPPNFPLRNVRSAFACLSSLDNFKPL